MQINILITTDNDEPLLNETVSNPEEAKNIIDSFSYEYEARLDHVTGVEHE